MWKGFYSMPTILKEDAKVKSEINLSRDSCQLQGNIAMAPNHLKNAINSVFLLQKRLNQEYRIIADSEK